MLVRVDERPSISTLTDTIATAMGHAGVLAEGLFDGRGFARLDSPGGGLDSMLQLALNTEVVTRDECDHNYAFYELSRDGAL